MSRFERVETGAQPPRDAVLVTVWRAFGRTVADVAAEDQIADFPRPVPLMLERAEAMREEIGLARVVVVIDDLKLWRPEWGELVRPA